MKSNFTSHFDLGFVTDGESEQALGIALLINYLKLTTIYSFIEKIWVVVAYEKINVVELYLSGMFKDVDFHFIGAEARNDDKYYIQVGLNKVFQQLKKHQRILCIDYDHLILNPKRCFDDSCETDVIVSSEIYKTFQTYFDIHDCNIDLPNKHINSSFILGKADSLRKIGLHWEDTYEHLRYIVPQRNRVELAFALAAQRAGVMLKPCSYKVQGNFAHPSVDTFLFHYGGESDSAILMKKKLSKLSLDANENIINIHMLKKLHEELVNDLICLL